MVNFIFSEESENRYGSECKVLMFMDVSFWKKDYVFVVSCCGGCSGLRDYLLAQMYDGKWFDANLFFKFSQNRYKK